MNLLIRLPFSQADRLTETWAHEEGQIDFRADLAGATRCTVAFAAWELKSHLTRTLHQSAIRFAALSENEASSPNTFTIDLRVGEADHADGTFEIVPSASGLVIGGASRTGVLYGVYEFLRMQGWRWYAPGKGGEIAPAKRDRLVVPGATLRVAPSMPLGRGFDFTYQSMESAEFFLWMARNRLNLAAPRGWTTPLCRKLGMELKCGGHIFEAILDPDRPMKSGRSLWDVHPAWFGRPAHGERSRETAQHTQFCVSQPDLMDYLGGQLLDRLTTEWGDADRVDIWGFDTWGDCCTCAACRALGNASDQALHLLSRLRAAVDGANADGQLKRRVRLVMCCYEGTATLAPPLRPCPANLARSGDYATFYPINRCYAHDLDDASCSLNVPYHANLLGWLAMDLSLPIMIGEYYNVSKFEDLPYLFTRRLAQDLPGYVEAGTQGITYMHVPLVNWGPRTVTQWLYAQLAWDHNTDVAAALSEYFDAWYGPSAEPMKEVYDFAQQASSLCASWRSWGYTSVLSRLLTWNGQMPTAPLRGDSHLPDASTMLTFGTESIDQLTNALALVAKQRRRIQDWGGGTAARRAVNPLQAARQELDYWDAIDSRLGEDWRGLKYGRDVMALTVELVAYHDALHRDEAEIAQRTWERVEAAAEALDSYYVPVSYEEPGAGLVSLDALSRSQLRAIVNRCRRARGNGCPPGPPANPTLASHGIDQNEDIPQDLALVAQTHVV